MSSNHHLIVICGPTGIGKTRVAIELALDLNSEIVSCDSRQFYKEMSIGTAVPSKTELEEVPHHFIQTHSIHNYYNASMYENEVLGLLQEYYKTKPTALLVGGSGLYIDAVCKGIDDLPTIRKEIRTKWQMLFEEQGLIYLQEKVKKTDPAYYQTVDLNNHKRLLKALEIFEQTGKPYSGFLNNTSKKRPFSIHKIGLNTGREFLYEEINKRVDGMVEQGLIDEAQQLYNYRNLTPLNTVGYKELFSHFAGEISLEEALTHIKNHSRAYARRQITWFRRDKNIKWFEPDELLEIKAWIHAQLRKT